MYIFFLLGTIIYMMMMVQFSQIQATVPVALTSIHIFTFIRSLYHQDINYS